MPVMTSPTYASIVPSVFQADREPSPMSSTLAGQLALQPLKAGFQNIVPATLKATSCAYSAMTTPHSNLERSRPVGQARPRWARAAK